MKILNIKNSIMSMKKCPYCAEDVQDKAIKCKHCGEWLNEEKQQALNNNVLPPNIESEDNTIKCDTCEIEKPSENFVNELSICKDCIDKESQNPPNENIEETDCSSPIKEKRRWRWGWGWFILLALYTNYFNQETIKHSSESYLANIVPGLGVFFLLFLYFKLRNRLFTWPFFEFRRSTASFLAGTSALFIALIIVTTSVDLISKADETVDIKKHIANYQKKAHELKQEDLKFMEKLISEPSSEADLQHNIKILDEYLIFMNKRSSASKVILGSLNTLINKKKDGLPSQNVQNTQLLIDRYYDVSEKSIKALRNYYKNVGDNEWNKYEKLYSEQQKLEIEVKSAIKQLFTKVK